MLAAPPDKIPFLRSTGENVARAWDRTLNLFTFLGENIIAVGNLLRGRAQYRWTDTFLVIEQCGPQALGIVALINFLMGLILAFVGAVQLTKFGASIGGYPALGFHAHQKLKPNSGVVCWLLHSQKHASVSILSMSRTPHSTRAFFLHMMPL